jgi:uncharacterized protein YdeI (YjbR/CyaY-like superfamily)
MAELKNVQPRSRTAWRGWLEKHHATSSGVWLVFAKKHTGLPSLSYDDAVEEALCFGWIDSLVKSLDDRFHMQMFTPRKAKSVWSAANRARVARLVKDGLMTPAGLALVALAKKTGRWDALAHVESLTVPPELQSAIEANAKAKRNWPTYSPSARKGFLYALNNAKRPETRQRRIREIVDVVARQVSMTELREAAMAGKRDVFTKRTNTTATKTDATKTTRATKSR